MAGKADDTWSLGRSAGEEARVGFHQAGAWLASVAYLPPRPSLAHLRIAHILLLYNSERPPFSPRAKRVGFQDILLLLTGSSQASPITSIPINHAVTAVTEHFVAHVNGSAVQEK